MTDRGPSPKAEPGETQSLTNLSALMLLIDGRFPAGGHAHSGGFEAAAALEGVTRIPEMERFLLGRLHTTGYVAAAFAAAACHTFEESVTGRGTGPLPGGLAILDREFAARTPSTALRVVSRRLGRQLIRAGRRIWPHPGLEQLATVPGDGLHQPIAFGSVAAAAGQNPTLASLAAAQESISGPATASVRLLGLDPFDVNALMARMAPEVAQVAMEASGFARALPADLPARAGYLLDISAEMHATWEVRLFAS